ncbi:MAG: hypothetical protein FWG13_05405 [Leptospirales bacterium]|nr:hypothetical protein [Leptospirales bacterium]
MNYFLKYDEKVALEVAREEAMERGIEKGRTEGKEEGQNYILELVAQGLSYEEIKKKVEKSPKKNRR